VTTNNSEKSKPLGKGVGFHRIRRVTGYLTGDLKFMNDAKRKEVSECVKHA
jgi:ribonucleoside-triphosphate reductase